MECTKCRRVLPASEFHKNRRSANGLDARCKECVRRYKRELHQRRKRANANRTYPSDASFWCPSCKQLLLAAAFSKNPMLPNGLQAWCKVCMNKKAKRIQQSYVAAIEAKSLPAVFMEPEDGELEAALALNTTSEVNEALSKFGLKWCPACRQAKEYADYSKDKYTRWGRRAYCKKCERQRKKGRMAA